MRRAAVAQIAACALVAIAALARTPGRATAAPEPVPVDYDAASERWNGLAGLVRLARGAGYLVETRRELSWNELGPGDALLVLYPTATLEAGDIAAFLHNGGRLLLADDFGASPGALAVLGLVRSAAVGVVAPRYQEGDQDLPIAPALLPEHPLAQGVGELVTNHPALFSENAGAAGVFGFGPGELVVAAGPLGAGRFVALSDPSVLINRMLELPGNLTFATNLLRFLVDPRAAGRVVIVTGDFALVGTPTRALDDQRGLGGWLTRLNGWLDELNLYSLHELAAPVVGALAALFAVALLLRALSGGRRPRLAGEWTRAAGPAAPPDAAALVAAAERPRRPGRRASYILPAALLRDEVNRRLAAVLEVDDPLVSLSVRDQSRALAARAGAGAAAALEALGPLLRAVPTRAQAGTPWAFAPLGRRDFDRLAAAVDQLYRTLGAAAAGPASPPPPT